jgi:hypothetical protein
MKGKAKMTQLEKTYSADSAYSSLYRLGGAAALIVAALTVGEIVGFMVYPQPSAVDDWFTLFQTDPVIGLLDFWGLEVPMYAMFVLVFLALYGVLRSANQGGMATALAFVLLGAGIFFATNNPFAMLSLSNQHAAATTDAQRSALLAAGEAVLANTGQRAVGGFNIGLFLVSVAGLIVSWVMLRSSFFSKSTAYVGILAYGLSLADYLRQALTQSELVALLVILPGALFLIIWYVLVARRLYQSGRLEGKMPSE